KADIAKQFDLPERQSKITTLLNQAGQAYCICRSSDSSRACDSCEEWYHGDCINISEREAKYIKNYFCERCREEDPTLKTRFRPQKRENEGDTEGSNKSRPKCKVRICVKLRVKPAKLPRRRRRASAMGQRARAPPLSAASTAARSAGSGAPPPGYTRRVLPQRIQEWSLSSCVAELKNRKALEVVRSGIAKAQSQLRALDKQHTDLDALVARAKNATIEYTDDKVMCPEHFKDPKVSDTDVCGCPLVRRVFEPTGEFCRAPKKACLKHYQWEKLRRAEIDMERVRQWLRLDELLEQERSIRLAMVMERIAKVNENGKLKDPS
ncbi:CpG-binding protein, partial [Operophtera brumata]